MKMKKQMYFTITGMFLLPDTEFLKPGMKVQLEKEPDNKYDKEAIMVRLPGLGKIGYVANSVKTVVGETSSAGRIYDKIADAWTGTVMYNMGSAVVCSLDKEPADAPEDDEAGFDEMDFDADDTEAGEAAL